MRTITQRELRNGSAAVMDAVEQGETLTITRNGVPVAELRPRPSRRRPSGRELVERARGRLPVSYDDLRREADDLFGSDRLADDR